MTVRELTAQMVVEAKRLGFSEATIWRSWMPGAGMVAKYYREQDLYVYDPAVTDKFLQNLESRYVSGEVSNNYLRQIRQIARRPNEFYLMGTLRINALMVFLSGISISLFAGATFFPLFYLGGEERNGAFLSKNEIIDTAFTAQCKLELIRTVIETLINMVEDNRDIKTPEQAMNFAYIQGTIDDFLHFTHDGGHFATQTLDSLQKRRCR